MFCTHCLFVMPIRLISFRWFREIRVYEHNGWPCFTRINSISVINENEGSLRDLQGRNEEHFILLHFRIVTAEKGFFIVPFLRTYTFRN